MTPSMNAHNEQQSIIAGALFDLMGYLTCKEKKLHLSASDDAAPAVEALTEWAERRGFDLDEARVTDWQAALAAQPSPVVKQNLTTDAAAQEAVYRAPWTGTPGRIDENGVEWRPVVGFEKFYEVSSEGRIFSLRHNRLLSNNSIASHGYIKAFFHGDGKRCQTFAHRAVAEAFLGPAEGREVNHLNGIRTDNRVENLDWVTRAENEIHSRYILGNLCEAVIAVSLRTGARVIFRSQAEAEAELCLPRDAVRRCLVGDFKSSMGWRFEKPSDSLAPVTAAPANDLHAHLLHMLGAKDHEEAGRIIGELHAATMRTPAAPGIDLYPIRCALQYAAAAARENTHTEMAEGFDALIRKIDASLKGTLNEQFGIAEGLDSPKGGSEARDAARWNELCQQFDAGMLPIAIIDDAMAMGSGALELHIDEAIRAQASDAEVRP